MSSFGGTVKLTGESEYRKALTQITQNLRETSSALSLVDSQYAKNDNSIQTVTAKNEKLNSILEKQKTAYNNLKSSFDSLKSKYDEQINAHAKLQEEYDKEKAKLEKLKNTVGENSTEYEKQKAKVGELATQLSKSQKNIDDNEVAMSKLRVQMNNAETAINKTTNEIDDLGKETKDTANEVKKAGDGFTVFKGIVSDLASKAIQSAISGLKKLGGAVIDVGKQALNSYADYEQLVGGVETLFKDSAKEVENYANIAYKTAGLSANEYMETVTSFSASLLQGLGGDTAKAAQIADMAIIDMSDNANKMGSSMESIQNAYQGFAKQNYTMLDNLKLGYGGTKSEMARLVKESGILGAAGEDLTAKNFDQKVSYDQIIEAIHKVQENMDITGTTSKEAASTISGSVTSMKKSWQNLLTAIADNNKDIGQAVDEFVESAITAGKNLVPRIKTIIDGIKKLISSIVTDVFPKLKKEIPQLKPLIEVFEWFIKNKGLVVNAIGAMVGAFAVSKILSFTKSMSDLVKKILEAAAGTKVATASTQANTAAQVANTTAQTAGAAATGLLTKATNLLNAAWKANPIGLILTGITALIGVFSLFKGKTDEATEATNAQSKAFEEAAEAAKETSKAYDDLRESQQNSINAGMTEISHLSNLNEELKTLVDENGNVQEGYEERASFITDTLADALGIEIDKERDLNEQVQQLTENIDGVIEKKKAQIILDSQETLYREAIEGQTKAVKELDKAEQELSVKKQERATLEAELTAAQEELSKNHDIAQRYRLTAQIAAIEAKMVKNQEDTDNLQTTYDTQKGLLEKYAYDVGQYEQNMALAHAGRYSEMSTVNWEYVQDYQATGDAEKAQLEDNIKNTEIQLQVLKELKEKSGSDLYDSQIAANEKLLAEQQESLKKYVSTTDNELKNNQKTWLDNAATVLSKLSDKNIEFKNLGNGQVQYYEDGIALGKPMAEDEAEKVAKGVLAEFDKEAEAEGAGKDVITGFTNGEGNLSLQNTAFATARNFASNILSSLKNKLGIASPSKETKKMGKFLIEGFEIGMEDEENSALKQASNFGKSLLSSLNSGLSGAIKTSAIADINSSISGINISRNTSDNIAETQANSSVNIIEAFKTALSQMKIEMDDEEMGKFVDKTVARTIYS